MDALYKPRQSKQPIVVTALATLAGAFLLWLVFLRPASTPTAPVVTKGDYGASGTVTLTQTAPGAKITITGELQGLDPRAERGFHIHTAGDLSSGCASAGSHFNPLGQTHGAPTDASRHIGDLGNIQSDAQGEAKFTIEDSLVSLNGPLSVVGRAIVLHAGTDDLGKGNNEESLKTGNAGGRAACGIIGISQ
ncbi:superoxide dismutase [Rhodofomes roseus]|uniref:Superoxide dismutase [Cu-Zn] n=1 Tax=Rhodofomes roseus TaxID=34475 RepID=A0ABQ8KS72_9APHY|nr:superoxide dismutase [Rhodofomes roseus]KAH9841658.1 superoxide dismutase [Rhodofomes roseus]